MRVTNTRSWLWSLGVVALAGCSTSHDSINIGGGQSPDPVVLDIPVAYVRGPVPLAADLDANASLPGEGKLGEAIAKARAK